MRSFTVDWLLMVYSDMSGIETGSTTSTFAVSTPESGSSTSSAPLVASSTPLVTCFARFSFLSFSAFVRKITTRVATATTTIAAERAPIRTCETERLSKKAKNFSLKVLGCFLLLFDFFAFAFFSEISSIFVDSSTGSSAFKS